MLAIRGISSSSVSNYMVFDPAVGPWRTVSLSGFSGYDANGNFRYFTEIFSPIYDITIIPGTEENGYNEIATARFPTGVPIKLRLLKPEYFGVNQWGDPTYKFPSFWADGLNGTGAGPGLDEPWRLIELNLANVPFTEVLVPNNGLQVLDVSGNNFLERLDCSLNQLTDATFNITNSGYAIEEEGELRRYIETLNARSNNLTTAPFIGLANNLVYYKYDVANNKISTLHVGRNSPTIFDASNQFPDDPTQGLTTHSFSDPLARPEVWRLHQNQLTSLPLGDLGVGGAWSRVRELSCYDNNLTELVFPDGPPPANYYDAFRGTTPGGYALRKLDVSQNNLTTLNLQYVDTLLDLNVSDNPLTNLVLPPNNIARYEENDSDDPNSLSYEIFDPNTGKYIPDPITGEWRTRWKACGQIPFPINDSRYQLHQYAHTRGVRRLILNRCSLTSLPANLLALRELEISQTPITQIGTWSAPYSGFPNGAPIRPLSVFAGSPWRAMRRGNIAIQIDSQFSYHGGITPGISVDDAERANFYALQPGRTIYVFRHMSTAGPTGGLRPIYGKVTYYLHRAGYVSGTTPFHFLTDRMNLENVASNNSSCYVSEDTPDITTALLNLSSRTVNGVLWQDYVGEVAVYHASLDFPQLETLTITDVPELTRINLSSAALLNKLVVKNCPNLVDRAVMAGMGFEATDNTDTSSGEWTGYSTHLIHVEIVNTRVEFVLLDDNAWYRTNFDVLRVENTNGAQTRFSVPFGFVCRNGAYFTGSSSSSDVELTLQRTGTWSFTPSLPTDSNVLSFAGCTYPLSRKAAFYDPQKATAVSRGWQVIDPTFV